MRCDCLAEREPELNTPPQTYLYAYSMQIMISSPLFMSR